MTGVSFPGDPLVILGHNERIAWGATNLGPDVEDLFIEKPDPNNSADYLFKGQSIPFAPAPRRSRSPARRRSR